MISLEATVLVLSYALVLVGADMPSEPLQVRDCPGVKTSNKATLKGVFITDCTEEPCEFKRGATPRVEMAILIKDDVKKMRVDMSAIIGLLSISLDGIEKDGCKGIMSKGHACPLKKNDNIRFGVDVQIDKNTPKKEADVMFQLKNESGRNLVCFIVKGKVV